MKLSWTLLKRNTDDPLIRSFIDRYNLHLLSVPRANASIGDLYRYDDVNVSTPGKISYFLEPAFEISKVTTGERMGDISGVISNGIDANFGLEFLDGFLMAVGSGGIINKIRNSYESKNTNMIKFRFSEITRDYTDPYWLSEEISDHTIKKNSAMYGEGYRYFLVTAVVRSPSINIIAEDEQKKGVDIDVEILQQLANISADISVEKAGKGEISFKGKQSLAFGVELYELRYDSTDNCFRFKTVTERIRLRDRDSETIINTDIKPAFIGASEEGNAFISLIEN
jgi:hypothetical protein